MKQLSERRKIANYSEAFYTKAEDIVIKDKKHPTRIEYKQVRKKKDGKSKRTSMHR